MSWKKQSAEAGLAGLTLRETALGALWDETMVKEMPDPLGQILDLSRVKKEDLFMVVRFTVYSCNVITVHSTVYMYVLKESKQVSRNAITVHSIVYMYLLKESKQVSRNGIYFLQVNDLDANKSWYKLREEAGLEIVDDEEEKMQKRRK